MADKRYDAVFLGNSLTALAAAALLSKQGRRVFLLDDLNDATAHLPDHGFHYSIGPLLYFGFEQWGAMECFFSELAFPIPTLQKNGFVFKKCASLLQIVQPSHRIDLYADREAYLDELKREYGNQGQKLKILFDQVEREAAVFYPYLGQMQQIELSGMGERLGAWRKQLDFSKAVRAQQKTSATDLLSQYTFRPEIGGYFNLLSLFAYRKPLAELNAFDFIMLLSGFQRGGVRLTGGYPTLTTFFYRLIKGWGGTIYKEEKTAAFERKGKEITGLRLSNGSTVSGERYIVSKPEDKAHTGFFFSLPQALLPPPMRESLVMTWGPSRPEGFLDLMVLRLNLPEEVSGSEPSIRRIAVSIFPRERRRALSSDRTILERKILDRLHWLIPFSHSKIVSLKNPDRKDKKPWVGDEIFEPMRSSDSSEALANKSGSRKPLIKYISYYLRAKDNKRLLILPSDLSDTVAWGSAFVAAKRLAKLLETA